MAASLSEQLAEKNLRSTNAPSGQGVGDRSAPIIPGTVGSLGAAGAAPVANNGKPAKTVLIVDYTVNWYQVLKGATLADGTPIKVEQTRWKHMTVETSSEYGCSVHMNKDENPYPFSTQKEDRRVTPDFILIRNFPTGLNDTHFTNTLQGLMFGNIPSCNSLHSIFMGMHRPLVYAEMARLNLAPAGPDGKKPIHIPLVPMTYVPNLTAERVEFKDIHPPKFPMVVKVSSPHAGYGKMRAMTPEDFDDLRSILMLHKDYYTTEPLIEYDYEYRVQKIGSHYRGFRRNSDTCWKNNWGNLQFVDHQLEEKHIQWIDRVATLWGGLDILAIDVLHMKNGDDIILELNDTANGLMWEHEEEDIGYIREILLQRMNEWFAVHP